VSRVDKLERTALTLSRTPGSQATGGKTRACKKTRPQASTRRIESSGPPLLSHRINDKLRAAYMRGDFLDKRRRLMAVWASFCTGSAVPLETSKVVST